ncbi:SET domain-containing protein [Daldinia bambusicola]|nr:SET domain-containing protein [Daldinia bambusicola]
MSQDHPYRRFHLPRDAPFELRPSSPGKGWGGFATRFIKRGEKILTEKPLFVIPKPSEHITEEDVLAAVARLTPVEKFRVSLLRDNADEPFKTGQGALAENSFALPACSGHGLFLLHSRFNHSCIPNARVPDPIDGIISLFAITDIMPGEEITFCYIPDFSCRIRSERHEALRFVCNCKACLLGTPSQQLSDARRKFIRGLQYLTHGVDFDGKRQDASSPIIADRKLKQAAESLSVPLSNRLIYLLLSLYLLDEEGLLDHLQRERLEPSVAAITSLFQAKSNAEIVKTAMAQTTWLGKVLVAFRLYGQYDAADEFLPELLRVLRSREVVRL